MSGMRSYYYWDDDDSWGNWSGSWWQWFDQGPWSWQVESFKAGLYC